MRCIATLGLEVGTKVGFGWNSSKLLLAATKKESCDLFGVIATFCHLSCIINHRDKKEWKSFVRLI